jgi:hypothetical protein
VNPEIAEVYLQQAQKDAGEKYRQYKHLAEIPS